MKLFKDKYKISPYNIFAPGGILVSSFTSFGISTYLLLIVFGFNRGGQCLPIKMMIVIII